MRLILHCLSVLCFCAPLVVSVPRGVRVPECTPTKDYGKPLFFDCVNAYLNMHNVEGVRTLYGPSNDVNPRVEFLGLGADRQSTQYPSVQTPRFYSSGTCRIAILMNGYPKAVSENYDWPGIAASVDQITRCPNHSGFMFKGRGHGRWPIGIHVYAVDSDFSTLVQQTIVQWVANAQGGAQQQPNPLPDPSNVGEEDPEISSTDDEGPSSSKKPKTGPSTYCSPQADCGVGNICGPLTLGPTAGFMLGVVASAVEDFGNCIIDPFSSNVARRFNADYVYGTTSQPHLGQAIAAPLCNRALYGKPLRADCSTAAHAMEKDEPQEGAWQRPTSYFGATAWPQEEQTPIWGYLKIPRTYQCGTCIVAINVGHNPIPDNEHDVASKRAVEYATSRMVSQCLGGGPTAQRNAGGLVIAGQRQKLWITAFHAPNLPRNLAKRRSRGYVNDPAVNAYLQTCDWPGGGSVKRTGVSCVAPNGIDDDLDQAQPDMDDATFATQSKETLHELAQGSGQIYCAAEEVCGLGFECLPLATTNFPLMLGYTDQEQANANSTGICIEQPL